MNSVLNVRIRELERQVYFQQDALKRADKWREALLFIARYDPYGAQWTAEKCLRETGSLAPQEVPTGGRAA